MLCVWPKPTERAPRPPLLLCGRSKCSELDFSINHSSCREKKSGYWLLKCHHCICASIIKVDPRSGHKQGFEGFVPWPSVVRPEITCKSFFSDSASAITDQLFCPVHSFNSIFIKGTCAHNLKSQIVAGGSIKEIAFFDPPLPEAIISYYFCWVFSCFPSISLNNTCMVLLDFQF